MVLAELEVYHSRPVAPTRRVALGDMRLPVDPPPGFGGILLGGIVAANIGGVDPDFLPDLARLTTRIEEGMNVPQPQLRHRLQKDRIGLTRSTHRLIGEGNTLSFEFDDANGDPSQQLLGAVYACGQMRSTARRAVMGTLRRAITWQGTIGPELITALAGFNKGASWSTHALSHPIEWALEVLEFGVDPEPAGVGAPRPGGAINWHGIASRSRGAGVEDANAADAANGPNGSNGADGANGSKVRVNGRGIGPDRIEIQRRYRQLLIEAHPDHGGQADDAAQRIADLAEARRILLG